MAEVFVEQTDAGSWLSVVEDRRPLLSAYIGSHAVSEAPFTITWNGNVENDALVEFCHRSVDMFNPYGGNAHLLGRVYAKGHAQRFVGSTWIEAANVSGPTFLRFECFTTGNADRDGFILWARTPDAAYGRADEDDEEENLGILLRPVRLSPLEPQLVSLITTTQRDKVGAGAIRRALEELSLYLNGRSTPRALSAAE